MENKTRSAAGEVGAENVGVALANVMVIPRAWLAAMVVLAFLSCLTITHPEGRGVEVNFGVTVTTIGVVALIWLPALIRLLSLTGGRLRAAGVEASSTGLLDSPEDLIVRLARIKTVTEEAKRRAPQAGKLLGGVDQEVDRLANEYLSGSDAVSERTAALLAREYERARGSMEPGYERTIAMTRIVNEASVRGGGDLGEAARLGVRLIRSAHEGERVVATAFLQVAPTREGLDGLLGLISTSDAKFETYHVLRALGCLSPSMSDGEKQRALKVVRAELADPRERGIVTDAYLPSLFEHVIAALESR